MTRRQADAVVAALLGIVLVGGGALTWDAYQRRQGVDGMMGSMMDSSMYGPDPLWYLFGTLFVAAAIAGGYLLVRDTRSASVRPRQSVPDASGPGASPPTDSTAPSERDGDSLNPEAQPQARVLDLLPDDERRILEPVLSSPGITQIELRDRADFSKSKVSQTVSALEERGLLYRERQGRTYRIYPSDDLRQDQS